MVDKSKKLCGADIIVNCLLENGVDTVFGYPGASVLSIYESLRKNKRKIRHILCTHEQYAAHAADGYARSTGKPGVVIATSGPGATNLVTGIANAFMDSIPLIAITGNVPAGVLGTDAFQEIDIFGVTMPITKHNLIAKSVDSLHECIYDAFRISQSGCPGPVLIDIPCNVLDEACIYKPFPAAKISKPAINEAELKSAVELINNSSSPIICAGGGVISANGADALYRLAHKLNANVTLTAMGKGAFPTSDRLYVGTVGTQANESTLNAFSNADLLIAVGTRFSQKLIDNILKSAPDIKVLHIDIDRAEIGKVYKAFSCVVGDANDVLARICNEVECKPEKVYVSQKVNAPMSLYGILNEVFDDAIYTTEVGLHQADACNMLSVSAPRTFLTSGGLGAMGFGLPAAIGAQIAHPDKFVINIAGDGSFNMNLAELSTAVKYSLPIITVIVNNSSLGMIEKIQTERYRKSYQALTNVKTDYVKLADAFGAYGLKATNEMQLRECLREARSKRKTTVIEYKI